MTKQMIIDAARSTETRVALLNNGMLEDYDYESAHQKQLKGNIYLAKVTRVEPSLQACFVDYGGNRHGFLAFSEIHPDYFQIPVSDRQKLLEEVESIDLSSDEKEGGAEKEDPEMDLEEAQEKHRAKWLKKMMRSYKIQEVIKKNQILLIQVVKEERGNKGAALTTYLSLAGRYCVLMPNTRKGGGVSRKIPNGADRKRLKVIIDSLDLSSAMSMIIRTAGGHCTKPEIKRDFAYLTKMWEQIRTDTLKATAPALIYEEADLIKRALRDTYTSDIDEVLVEGQEALKAAKDFMKILMPSHAKKIKGFEESTPIFHKFGVEDLLHEIHTPTVQLRSGGYLVINSTEALVAIDVNSGRATRERDIEKTALKTNLEAAVEAARQMHLRDLSGLIVIDFIDMLSNANNRKVEKAMRDALKTDRARVQASRISDFGLMELSRQRLRPSISDTHLELCPTCGGIGKIPTPHAVAGRVLRQLEEIGLEKRGKEIIVKVPQVVVLEFLNRSRRRISELEEKFELTVTIQPDSTQSNDPFFEIEGAEKSKKSGGNRPTASRGRSDRNSEEGSRRGGRRRGRRGGRRRHPQDGHTTTGPAEQEQAAQISSAPAPEVTSNSAEATPSTKEAVPRAEKNPPSKTANKKAATTATAAPSADNKSAEKPADKKPAPKKAASKKSAPKKVAANTAEKVKVIAGSPEKPRRGWWGGRAGG